MTADLALVAVAIVMPGLVVLAMLGGLGLLVASLAQVDSAA